jgi:hypothetical protein
MVPRLSNIVFFVLLVLSSSVFAQKNSDGVQRTPNEDYQKQGEKNDFRKYGRRSETISKWQINQLKKGALIVRLPTNAEAIKQLRLAGNTQLADKKENETMAINALYYRAISKEYKFSKLYFIYSTSSDSLLKGIRKGIFLDSLLQVNDSIQMEEGFYMLAERDMVHNSSIGFVKKEDAQKVREIGAPTKGAFLVLKNKFGHQLKDPFPYFTFFNSFARGLDKEFVVTLTVNGGSIYLPLNFSGNEKEKEAPVIVTKDNRQVIVALNRIYRLNYLRERASRFNERLTRYYNSCKGFEVTDPNIQPFLY